MSKVVNYKYGELQKEIRETIRGVNKSSGEYRAAVLMGLCLQNFGSLVPIRQVEPYVEGAKNKYVLSQTLQNSGMVADWLSRYGLVKFGLTDGYTVGARNHVPKDDFSVDQTKVGFPTVGIMENEVVGNGGVYPFREELDIAEIGGSLNEFLVDKLSVDICPERVKDGIHASGLSTRLDESVSKISGFKAWRIIRLLVNNYSNKSLGIDSVMKVLSKRSLGERRIPYGKRADLFRRMLTLVDYFNDQGLDYFIDIEGYQGRFKGNEKVLLKKK